jgi:hypothetical protein
MKATYFYKKGEEMKIRLLLWMLLYIILCVPFVFASEPYGGYGSGGGRDWSSVDYSDTSVSLDGMSSSDIYDNFDALNRHGRLGDSSLNQEALAEAFRRRGYGGVGRVDLGGSDVSLDGDVLSVNGNTIDLSTFNSGSHTIEASGGRVLVDGNVVMGGDNIHLDGGVLVVDRADYLRSGRASIRNGVNVKVIDGGVEADSGELVRFDDGSFVSGVSGFSMDYEHVFVESADVVNNDCVYFYNVSSTEFVLDSSGSRLASSNSRMVIVDDCGYHSLVYEAGEASGLVVKAEEGTYEISRGRLLRESDDFSESIEANGTATVFMDYYGFSCLNINPVGVYNYNFRSNKTKDFSIEIPSYGYDYKLCIRKDRSQSFDDFDGIADLVDGFNDLSGIVNYLRYPLKDGELAGLVLEDVYQGFAMPVARMFYDSSLVFLDNVSVSIPYSDNTTVSLTVPSNYYMIKEEPMEDGIHTLVKVDTSLSREELTDSIIRNYNGFIIANNVLVKDNLMVLSPGHEMIAEVLG